MGKRGPQRKEDRGERKYVPFVVRMPAEDRDRLYATVPDGTRSEWARNLLLQAVAGTGDDLPTK